MISRTIINHTYDIEVEQLERVLLVKDICLYIDHGLTLRNHVSHVVGSAIKVLGIISRSTKHFKRPHCEIYILNLFCSRLQFVFLFETLYL